jgi:hypothetical protein
MLSADDIKVLIQGGEGYNVERKVCSQLFLTDQNPMKLKRKLG